MLQKKQVRRVQASIRRSFNRRKRLLRIQRLPCYVLIQKRINRRSLRQSVYYRYWEGIRKNYKQVESREEENTHGKLSHHLPVCRPWTPEGWYAGDGIQRVWRENPILQTIQSWKEAKIIRRNLSERVRYQYIRMLPIIMGLQMDARQLRLSEAIPDAYWLDSLTRVDLEPSSQQIE